MTGYNEGIHMLKYFFYCEVVIGYRCVDVVFHATAITRIMTFVPVSFGGQKKTDFRISTVQRIFKPGPGKFIHPITKDAGLLDPIFTVWFAVYAHQRLYPMTMSQWKYVSSCANIDGVVHVL